MKNKELKKDFIWNTIGSSFHSFNSLFFLIIVTRINGIETAGYFSFAFMISNLFLKLSTYGGRNYQVTDVKNEFSDNEYITFRLFTTIISTIVFSLFFLLFNYSPNKYLAILLLIFVRVFESISDVYFGIFQKNNNLYKVGVSLFFKNLISLITFFALDKIFNNVLISLIGWVIINILFLLLYDIPSSKKLLNKKIKLEFNIKNMFKKCTFFCLYIFIISFVLNIPRYFIDFYLPEEMQGIYGIIIMPATMTMLLCQFILSPYMVRLSSEYKSNKEEYKKDVKKISLCMAGLSLVCIFLAYLFGIPVLNLIYGVDLNPYKLHLIIIMFASMIYVFIDFLALIYTIKRKTKEQFIIYLISLVISVIVTYFLIKYYTFMGGIISYLIIMIIIMLLYLIDLKIIQKNK